MAQRQKRPQKTFSKYEKSKVNYVILLYKNNAKINKPLLVRSFFFLAFKRISVILLYKLKEKDEKNP
jgi:hypothetical protein